MSDKIDGEKLVGEWTIGGADGTVYPETLTRMGDLPPRESPPQKQQQDNHPQTPRKPASLRPAVAEVR